MADAYLEVAKKVLEARGHPMTAQEILSSADRFGMLPTHLSGATMHKTLQARITEDLYLHRSKSIFYRTGRGLYFLRSLENDTAPLTIKSKEVTPPGRRSPPPEFRILTTSVAPSPLNQGKLTIVSSDILSALTFSYEKIDRLGSSIKIATFTIVSDKNSLLIHTVGKHSHHQEARGSQTIGFRRYVDEFDCDLLSETPHGIQNSAAKEVLRHLRIERDNAKVGEDELVQMVSYAGLLYEPDAKQILLVFLVDISRIGAANTSIVRRLDANKVHWLNRSQINKSFLDKASQACFDEACI